MKKNILIICVLFIGFNLHAQDIFQKGRYNDTIFISGENISIEVICKYIAEGDDQQKHRSVKAIFSNVFDMLYWMKEDIKPILPELSGYKAVQIEYTYMHLTRSLKYKSIEPEKEIYGSSLPMENASFPNVCRFYLNDEASAIIYFKSIDDLLKFDFKKVYKQLIYQKVKTHWYPENFVFEMKRDSIVLNKSKTGYDMYLSSIDLNYGISLIKQQPTIDFGMGMSLIISTETTNNDIYLWHKLKLNYAYMSYFDNNAQKLQLNGFFNAGYALNIPRSSRWIGLEAGYLVHRNGEMFNKNTVFVGLSLAGGKIDFTPKVYLSEGTVSLGFSLNLIGL